ncbi:MAG: hypothetical protein OEM22_00895 [Acidimicrobiia bacterium]|nr:hypothetical protein [Acidimicrobiia bacterium]MDH3470228.1 hypothetical protein [Acidimicrobiia bacterium]
MRYIFAIPGAGVSVFFSAWVLMLYGGILKEELGNQPFSYGTALLATIVLWVVIAPVIGAIAYPAWRGAKW